MKCPDCGERTIVASTDLNGDGSRMYRIRECSSCHFRQSTREMWVMDVHAMGDEIDKGKRLDRAVTEVKKLIDRYFDATGTSRARAAKQLRRWIDFN